MLERDYRPRHTGGTRAAVALVPLRSRQRLNVFPAYAPGLLHAAHLAIKSIPTLSGSGVLSCPVRLSVRPALTVLADSLAARLYLPYTSATQFLSTLPKRDSEVKRQHRSPP
jgi:hypothetical protein